MKSLMNYVLTICFVCSPIALSTTFEEAIQIEDDSRSAAALKSLYGKRRFVTPEEYDQLIARAKSVEGAIKKSYFLDHIVEYSSLEIRQKFKEETLKSSKDFAEGAIRSLNFTDKNEEYALNTLKEFYNSSSDHTLKAETLRGILRNSDGREMAIIENAMADNQISRKKIIRAIREDGSPAHLPFIIDILRDSEDNDIRKAAIDGLDELIRRHATGAREERLLACMPQIEVTPLSEREMKTQATMGAFIPVLLLGARTHNKNVPQISAEYAQNLKDYFQAHL